MNKYIYIHERVCICTYGCNTYVCIFMDMYVCVCVGTSLLFAHIYINKYACIHTYTHIRMGVPKPEQIHGEQLHLNR